MIEANPRKLICLMVVFIVLVSVSLFSTEVGALPTSGTVKIMPLGDSLTVGYPGLDGYRKGLYQDLTSSTFDVNFVGSQNNGTSLDKDNEGHLSYQANEIRDNVIGWLDSNPADIVLLHIGTNDIQNGQNAAAVVAEVASILDNIDLWESIQGQSVTVILARIILRGDSASLNATTKSFDDMLQTMAQARIASGDQIIVVDMENALNYPADLASDGIHPTPLGYEKIADVWYNALVKILGYSLTINYVGHGTVTKLPDQAAYPYGAVVNLTAQADNGWIFNGWSGDLVSSTNPASITMDNNKTVTANFTQIQYKLTVATNFGSTTPSVGEYWYAAGSNVTIKASSPTAQANENYSWLGWAGSGSGSYTGTNNQTTITMNGSITETSSWRHEYKLTLSSNAGTLTPPAGEHWFEAGTPVAITASPPTSTADTRASWDGWTGIGANSYNGNNNPVTVTMNGPITQTASWKTEYKLIVTTNLGTTQPPAGETWYPAGTTVNAEASPPAAQAGTQFICTGWSGTGSVPASGTTTTYSFTLNAPLSIAWTWKTQYYLTVNSAYGNTGGTGWYDAGTSAYATINPTTVSQYVFARWSDGASGDSSPSNPIIMDNPKTATANWSPIQTSTPTPTPTPIATPKSTPTPTSLTPSPSATISPSTSSLPSGSPSPSTSTHVSDGNDMSLLIYVGLGLVSVGIIYLAVRKVRK